MGVSSRAVWTAVVLFAGAVALAGCPLEFEKEDLGAAPPSTFYEVSPPDTSFSNQVFFVWQGTDLDSDVVAYQYQFVQTDSLYFVTGGLEGQVIRSLDPRVELQPGDDDVIWSDRTTDNSQSFVELDDGWFEMRVRAIDDDGQPDTTPARHRFYVFFDDRAPEPIILSPCARLDGVTSWTFLCDAQDFSRRGIETPRTQLEYTYQLRAQTGDPCTHQADSATDWKFFPDESTILRIDGSTITIDGGSGTQYNDFFDQGCRWDFTFRVRDPAGNIATTVCTITQL
jgi:hypothetical protein